MHDGKKDGFLHFVILIYSVWTGLVSRVLYVLKRSNHLSSLAVTDKFKSCDSATHGSIQAEHLPFGIQGVASDRVYSEPMLP